MRILHVINSLDKGGAERLLVNTLPLYRNQKISLMALTRQNEVATYKTLLQKRGITYICLGEAPVRSPFVFFKLLSFFKKHKSNFDVIHVHLFPSLYYVSLAIKLLGLQHKIVCVYTEHSTQNKRAIKSYFKPVEKWFYKHYDAIVAISPAVKERLIQLVEKKEQLKLIRNGVDLNHFTQAKPYSKEEMKTQFRLPEKGKMILMTARFKHPKDQITLINALAQLPKDVHLFFVGDGDLNRIEQAKSVAKSEGVLDRVHILGFRTDVNKLMKTANINVLSSSYEGMSGVTLEALACKKPYLGSNVVGIKEIVPDSRYLFSSGQSCALSKKIKLILADTLLCNEMIEDGIAFVKQFDISKMIQEHLNLYQTLAREKNSLPLI